jgi:hypothetical protein
MVVHGVLSKRAMITGGGAEIGAGTAVMVSPA